MGRFPSTSIYVLYREVTTIHSFVEHYFWKSSACPCLLHKRKHIDLATNIVIQIYTKHKQQSLIVTQPQGCNLRCSAMRRKAFICSGSFASIDRSFAKALGVLCVQNSGGKPFTGEKWQLENVCQVGSIFHETLLSLTFSWRFWKIQTSQTPGICSNLYILYHFLFKIPLS